MASHSLPLLSGLHLSTSEKIFRFQDTGLLLRVLGSLFLGGILAFGLGFSEFLLVSRTSSLTLSIAGIFKVQTWGWPQSCLIARPPSSVAASVPAPTPQTPEKRQKCLVRVLCAVLLSETPCHWGCSPGGWRQSSLVHRWVAPPPGHTASRWPSWDSDSTGPGMHSLVTMSAHSGRLVVAWSQGLRRPVHARGERVP